MDRFWSKVNKDTDSGCYEWTGAISGNGYGHYVITVDPFTGEHVDGRALDVSAHRYAWALEHGRWPAPGMVIAHDCDNTLCVLHTRETTQADNCADRAARSNWSCAPKLTDQEVRTIRASDCSQIELARKYRVSQVTINNVKARRHYAHV